MRITLPNPKRFSRFFESVTGISLNENVSGICTDSRQCLDDDLYIAIRGERADGNDFIYDAKKLGASAVLTDKEIIIDNGIQVIKVDDVIESLGKIAKKWRDQYNIPIIGITGSNGKTTTKNLTRHLLSAKYNVHSTKGNFNTSVSLPLTLLLIEDQHDISVIEMGANQPGDIKHLADIAKPTDGLITNVGPAHLEGFGSVSNVLKEKSQLFNSITNGRIFKNVSDDLVKSIPTSPNTIEYGCKKDCAYSADYYREEDGNIILIVNTKELNLGSQNIVFAKNVLAASTIANTFGIDWETIQRQISSFNPTYGRSVITKQNDITIIDDTYNANYTSTVAALENLQQLPSKGRKIFVFGSMAELGDHSEEYHRKVGTKCSELGLNAVFVIGSDTLTTINELKNVDVSEHFMNKDDLIERLKKFLKKGDTVLFKGSRSMEIEKIIQEVFKK